MEKERESFFVLDFLFSQIPSLFWHSDNHGANLRFEITHNSMFSWLMIILSLWFTEEFNMFSICVLFTRPKKPTTHFHTVQHTKQTSWQLLSANSNKPLLSHLWYYSIHKNHLNIPFKYSLKCLCYDRNH